MKNLAIDRNIPTPEHEEPAAKPERSLQEQLEKILDRYALSIDEVVPEKRTQLLILMNALEKTKKNSAKTEIDKSLSDILKEQLSQMTFQKIDRLEDILANSLHNQTEVENGLRELMESMRALGNNFPMQEAGNEKFWEKLIAKFKLVVEFKKQTRPEISRAFSRIFDEYADFIEDEFVTREIQRIESGGRSANWEKVVQDVYGRTPEEMEEQKTVNRVKVAEAMRDATDEPIDLDLLLEFYKLNNRGIAPKAKARLRRGNEQITFGKRFGIIPGDIPEEMDDFTKRTAQTMAQAQTQNWSDEQYQVAVAQLHNELLEIHPFPDRNGSMGVIFMELMMQRRGYQPPASRVKDYHANIGAILGNNPAALAMIAEEMKRMHVEWGYFPGKSTERRKKDYAFALRKISKGAYVPPEEQEPLAA